MEMSTSSLRLSGSLHLTPSTVDEAAMSASTDAALCTPPSIERLKDAYQRASLALATDAFPTGFPSEPCSWDRKAESEDDRQLTLQSTLDRAWQAQAQRLEEQMRRVFRDVSALRQDVDTVMMISSRTEAQQVENSRNWSVVSKESMDLLIQVTEDQKNLKQRVDKEAVSFVHTQMAQIEDMIRQEAMDREKSDADISNTIRQVLEQGIAFREDVLREAGEQRAALAKEVESNLELTLEQRLADVAARCGSSVQQMEQRTADVAARCGSSVQQMEQRTADVAARCAEIEQRASNSELAVKDVKQQFLDEGALGRAAEVEYRTFIERSRAEWQQFTDKMKEQLQQSEEAMAVVAENLQEEIKERTALNGRLRSETDQRTKVTSAVWLEVANVQQQVAELRETLRLEDVQGQLAEHKEAGDTRHGSLMASLEEFKQTMSGSFEKHKTDMSVLRDHMTDHMSWVASSHETALAEIKTKVSSKDDQIKELYGHVSHLHDMRSGNVVATANSRIRASTPSQSALVARQSSSNASLLSATNQLQVARPVSPMRIGRSLPQAPSIFASNSYASPGGPPHPHRSGTSVVDVQATTNNGASITVSTSSQGETTVTAGNTGGAMQRVPSTGFISARFGKVVGPSRVESHSAR